MILATWMFFASDALACSCAQGLDAARPEDGATGVPVDATPFLLFSSSPGTFVLRDAVELVERPGRLVPPAPLAVVDAGAGGRFDVPHSVTRYATSAPTSSSERCAPNRCPWFE